MTRSSTVTSPVKRRNSTLSKTIVSRIAAPFASKQRSPVELEIRLDEPFRPYFCGDTVKGAVRLSTSRASRITHLVIRLHGFVKVVNNVRLPGETIPYDENLLTSVRRRKGIEYFGNGFARLFEDERVLCGDGRVDGEYEFRFELDLPSKNIPSSIDFEHGTISYLLTATLTRPTTISPTLTIHHKLNVTGTIDIASLSPPRPRIVSLKISCKPKKAKIPGRRKSTATPNSKASICSSHDGNSINGLSSPTPQAIDMPPQSPAPSTISSTSTGESTLSAHNESQNAAVGEAVGGIGSNRSSMPREETTTAKTELLQGGCLPGDTLQLRISVNHRKSIKTMQGIIITVFRQGRIDTHPALPLGLQERGGKSQYEDYYPKSRTGLGGLSLTSAGSSRVFRQDLAQTIMPFIVDPLTLSANIKTSIQMPDHVFPTITCVPGGMISFKYYVEIVIDLRGKSAGQDRFLPHLSITNLPQHSYEDSKVSKIDSGDGVSYSATPGFNCLITDQIKRSKDVVFTTTEVIVGTKDSARSRGKRRKSSIDMEQSRAAELSRPDRDHHSIDTSSPTSHHPTRIQAELPNLHNSSDNKRSASQTPILPPPDLDEPQDEKSRIRRAEERLLPSSPPEDDGPPAASVPPTAPFANDEEDFVMRYGMVGSAPSYEEPSTYTSSAGDSTSPSLPTLQSRIVPPPTQMPSENQESQRLQSSRRVSDNVGSGCTQDDLSNQSRTSEIRTLLQGGSCAAGGFSSSPAESTQEDKQELERKRLEAQTSSPDDASEDEGTASSSIIHQSQHPIASAPTLDEVELAHTHDDHDDEDLPVYRR